MNTGNTTEQRVIKVMAEQSCVDAENIKPESKVVDDLGCDSLDVIEIAMALEEEFEIMLADEDVEACSTVADVIAMVNKMLGHAH